MLILCSLSLTCNTHFDFACFTISDHYKRHLFYKATENRCYKNKFYCQVAQQISLEDRNEEILRADNRTLVYKVITSSE